MCDEFIHREILTLTINRAFQRGRNNPVYDTENDERRKELRKSIKRFLSDLKDHLIENDEYGMAENIQTILQLKSLTPLN